MRVHIDDQAFLYQRHGGVGRYFAELIREFRASLPSDVEVVTPFRYVQSEHLAGIDRHRYKAVPLPNRLLHGRGAPALRLANLIRPHDRDPVDVRHHTFYLPNRLDPSSTTPQVCTVHDMIPELFPDPSLEAQGQGKRAYVKACDGIVFVSETTRKDCLRLYGHQDKPTAVTPHGVAGIFFRQERRSPPFPPPYVLYVGQRHVYKNFSTLLQAIAGLPTSCRSLKLACVGGGPLSEGELALIRELGIDGRVLQAGLDDSRLSAAYQHATCFVSPSKIEGFGIPALEAFASGCPVLLADTPIFREVGGEVALFFPPNAPDALSEVLIQIMSDRRLCTHLSEKGLVRAREYTWKRSAQRTLAFYRTVLSNR